MTQTDPTATEPDNGPTGSIDPDLDPVVVGRFQRAARVIGWLGLTLGLVVLVVGWWLGLDIVARVVPGSVTMKANTAVGIAASGFALIFLGRRTASRLPLLAILAGGLVTVIGWVTVIEYATGVTWTGFDEFLSTEGVGAIATSNPGRMGANTAIDYSLLGPALILLALGRGAVIRQALALMVILVGFTASLGYAFGVPELASLWGNATQMAINTSLMHTALGFAVLLHTPDENLLRTVVSRRLGGVMVRRYLPIVVAAGVALTTLEERLLQPLVGDHSLAVQITQTVLAVGVVAMIISQGKRVDRLDRHAERVRRSRSETSELNRRLNDLIESRDQLVAAVSHELRTPLTAIIGFTDVLQCDADDLDESERQDMLATIGVASTDLADIVEDLLTVTKFRSGDLTVTRVPVDLTDQIQVAEMIGAAHGVEIETRSSGPILALGDPGRIRQVVRNLVGNAIVHGDGTIVLELERSETESVVSVSDEGPGVPTSRADSIFDAYERGRDGPGQPLGLGLGLTISRQLARMMGGDLTYRRIAGRTVFRFSLEQATTEQPRLPDVPTHSDAVPGHSRDAAPRVAIAARAEG